MLRVEKRKMWEEQIALQEFCEEVKKLLKDYAPIVKLN